LEEQASISIPDEGTIRNYYDLRQQIATYTADMRSTISLPQYCMPFIQPGRLVQIKHEEYDFGWGVVVNCQKRRLPNNATEPFPDHESHALDVLLEIADGPSIGTKSNQALPPGVRPVEKGEKSRMEVISVMLNCMQAISHIRVFLPDDLKSVESRNGVKRSLAEVNKRFPDGIALLDPIENMNIQDEKFKQTLRVSNLPMNSFSVSN
jgi:ATP-dependent RNA helicase DOB1